MNQKNITVLRKILYAVESGGQVYGKQNYAAFAGVGKNTPNEVAITIGAGQWYGARARLLLQQIKNTYPTEFSRLDTAGIAADLEKSWDRYGVTAGSTKGKCIIAIISSDAGMKCQDNLMDKQIVEHAADIEKIYGAMPDTAMMECINIVHLGGASALERILAKTAKPYTAKSIYTALNTDPADRSNDNQVGDYVSRQKKVYEFITKYADAYVDKETQQKEKNMVRVSNCGHDENGRYAGGKAGDQTGGEYCLKPWYSRPWDYIIRWRDEELGNLFADLAIEAALNDRIGYDQGTAGNSGDRYTFRKQMQEVGWRPSSIKVACEADCSESTIVLIRAVGHLKGIKELQKCNATYTGDMMHYFQSAAGKQYFVVLQGAYLADPSLARRGDINLNVAHHVNVTVDNGEKNTGNEIPDNPDTNAGGSRYMFSVGNVKSGTKGNDVKLLQRLLKSNGFRGANGKLLTIDGDCGTNTVYAIKSYQKKKGLSADGIAGPATWKCILLR